MIGGPNNDFLCGFRLRLAEALRPVQDGQLRRLDHFSLTCGAAQSLTAAMSFLREATVRAPVFALAGTMLAVVAAGGLIAPSAWRSWRMFEAADDPVARAELRLNDTLTATRVAAEIDAALAAEDEGLANSFVGLANEQGVPVDPRQHARLDALRADSSRRAVRDFFYGFANGRGDSDAAFFGAVAADTTGYGDLRDLWNEGRKLVTGEQADQLVLGVAALGLAVNAAAATAIVTSAGGALPAVAPVRTGLTVLKTAQKTARLPRPLVAALTRTAAKAIDRDALKAAVATAPDLAAARKAAQSVFRAAALEEFRTLGQDVGKIYARIGQRGAREALALAETPSEVRQAARLAVAKGTTARAIFRVLGRSALLVLALGMQAGAWLFAFAWYLFALALLARQLGLWLGRIL